MTKKQIQDRLNILEQQLTLINLYTDHFLERLGKKGLEHFINEILDEMNYLKNQSKK